MYLTFKSTSKTFLMAAVAAIYLAGCGEKPSAPTQTAVPSVGLATAIQCMHLVDMLSQGPDLVQGVPMLSIRTKAKAVALQHADAQGKSPAFVEQEVQALRQNVDKLRMSGRDENIAAMAQEMREICIPGFK